MAARLGQAFDSFDGLIAGMAQAVRVGFGLHSALFERCDLGAHFDLVVAGWSESRGRAKPG